MSRSSESEAHSAASANPPGPRRNQDSRKDPAGAGSGVWVTRAVFVVSMGLLAAAWRPAALSYENAAGLGAGLGLLLILAELLISRGEPARVLGGAVGATTGIFAALLMAMIFSRTTVVEPTKSFLAYGCLLGFGYLGLSLGAAKGHELSRHRAGYSHADRANLGVNSAIPKLLDTSVLIDGRIAEICEAQFLEGPLQVPRFVLHELQMIADSSEALRRQRGRRGLEVLQRIQKLPGLEVTVLEEDRFFEGDVDRALVELARRSGAKIVTNDFNLNKVASVQGIGVLNVNQLANSLRPAVLPGESMRVMILREGKEANQGVAYLEDGTMVVVDGARRHTNKTVDITVTSVHQTPAGKMIFGRLEERAENNAPIARQAAAGRSASGAKSNDAPTTDRDPK
ncbi:MAG: hypothetical protein NVS9B14_10320 [Candidatus Acidiferrum sp.]